LFCLLILVPLSWNYIFINGLIDGASLYYPYDLPSLTLFSLGTILFCKRNWFAFYPMFLLALINRESSCFISIAGFLLCITPINSSIKNWIKQNNNLFYHVLTQAVLWLCSRTILSWIFKENPGLFFEQPHSMYDFLVCLMNGESHWAMRNPLWFLTIFAGIWIIPTVLYRYIEIKEKKLLICGIIYLVSLTLRSNMMEVRVYNELNVIIFVISATVFLRAKEKIIKNYFVNCT
jgi:hypothetical protein